MAGRTCSEKPGPASSGMPQKYFTLSRI